MDTPAVNKFLSIYNEIKNKSPLDIKTSNAQSSIGLYNVQLEKQEPVILRNVRIEKQEPVILRNVRIGEQETTDVQIGKTKSQVKRPIETTNIQIEKRLKTLNIDISDHLGINNLAPDIIAYIWTKFKPSLYQNKRKRWEVNEDGQLVKLIYTEELLKDPIETIEFTRAMINKEIIDQALGIDRIKYSKFYYNKIISLYKKVWRVYVNIVRPDFIYLIETAVRKNYDDVVFFLLDNIAFISDYDVDYHIIKIFHYTIIIGNEKIFNQLLSDEKYYSSLKRNEVSVGLIHACQYSRINMVNMILKDRRTIPTYNNNNPIRAACIAEKENIEIIKMLLKYTGVRADVEDNFCIKAAVEARHINTIKLLLTRREVDPRAENNYTLLSAVSYSYEDVVEILLKDRRADPADRNNLIINIASQMGYHKIIRLLLEDGRADPINDDNFPIRLASENGHYEAVEELLKNTRVDPSADNNYPVRIAAERGYVQILNLLLSREEVDPTDEDNEALEVAINNYKPECVKILLEDGRSIIPVNAWVIAAASGMYEIVELILKSGKLDPSVRSNAALKSALRHFNYDIALLLLKDKRFVIDREEEYDDLKAMVDNSYTIPWVLNQPASLNHLNEIGNIINELYFGPMAKLRIEWDEVFS